MDIRGHGKSEGKRGYLENMNTMIEDFKNFINTSDALYTEKTENKFVLGFSLGGLYANLISLAMPNYFNGMIMISPPLSVDIKKYDFLMKIANFLRNVFPSLPLIRIKCNEILLN
jgi:acylglycerol lipase